MLAGGRQHRFHCDYDDPSTRVVTCRFPAGRRQKGFRIRIWRAMFSAIYESRRSSPSRVLPLLIFRAETNFPFLASPHSRSGARGSSGAVRGVFLPSVCLLLHVSARFPCLINSFCQNVIAYSSDDLALSVTSSFCPLIVDSKQRKLTRVAAAPRVPQTAESFFPSFAPSPPGRGWGHRDLCLRPASQ